MLDFVTGTIEATGYVGILFLMFLENIFPPIPSEVILPLSGYQAVIGDLNIWLVIVVAALGATLGALPWYYLGFYFNTERLQRLAKKYGRIMTVSPRDIRDAGKWFDKHGKAAVFFGRFLPIFRTLISVPAGSVRMNLPLFLTYTFLGSLIWSGALAYAGYYLRNNFKEVDKVLDPLSTGIVVLIVVMYLYRVITFHADTK